MFKKSLLRFTIFDSMQLFKRFRWFFVFLLLLVLTYLEISKVMLYSSQKKLSANNWDVLFSVFGSHYGVLFYLTPVILYLTSDLVFNRGFTDTLLLRIGSRKHWWISKTLTLGIAISAFVAVGVLIAAALSSFVLPWQFNWSKVAVKSPDISYLNPDLINAIKSPALAFFALILLLVIGWYGLCLLSMIVTLYTGKHFFGFAASILVVFISIIIMKYGYGPPASYFSVHHHLLFSWHRFGSKFADMPPLYLSISYWMLMISFSYIIGYMKSLKYDFLD